MHAPLLPRPLHPLASDRRLLVEVFAFANLAFLTLDIYVAHSVNAFRHPAEWVPFVFCLAGAVALGAGLVLALRTRGEAEGVSFERGPARWIGLVVGVMAIVVGVTGLVFHLESQFFAYQTLRELVYSAPFVAPLAFTGVGFLLLLDRLVPPESLEWGQWVTFLALAGFFGNFVLALADHAQNGFFHAIEWIPVGSAALAIGYLVVALGWPQDRTYLRLGWIVLGLQVAVGLLGFVLHLLPSVAEGAVGPLRDRIVYGAPVFAPLLFPNLALLAGIGLWDLAAKASAAPSADEARIPG